MAGRNGEREVYADTARLTRLEDELARVAGTLRTLMPPG
jgi:hypothetical protein